MFLVEFPNFKDYNDQEVHFLQPKFDGHLLKIHKSKKLVGLSKNDKVLTPKINSCPQVKKVLDCIPDHSILFAELFSKGAATDVPTLLNEGSDKLRLRVFAAPVFATANLFNRDLCEVETIITEAGIPFALTKRICHASSNEKYKQDLLDKAIELGQEGWVLKLKHMKKWYKLKPTKTCDAFVLNTTKSFSANNFGEIQSLVVAVYHQKNIRVIADVGGGLSAEMRKEDPKSMLNKVCEIEYDSLAKTKLKFSRFVRWRTDKEPKDCKWSQLC